MKKPRIGFTIILNGEIHLIHNNYADYLMSNVFDYWVVVEGACESTGSTRWCTGDNSKYHSNGNSIDGTIHILKKLKSKYGNKFDYLIAENGKWISKDEMVNVAIDMLRKKYTDALLWEVDIDEQWKIEDMIINEKHLLDNKGKTGKVRFYQYVGYDIIAVGPKWGGNTMNRLWDWKGEYFETHEPPILKGGNGVTIELPKKYHHYSYYFEDDVKFKSEWYGYGVEFFKRWKVIQETLKFPIPLSSLFPHFDGTIYNIHDYLNSR
jgi:hypothetical protein